MSDKSGMWITLIIIGVIVGIFIFFVFVGWLIYSILLYFLGNPYIAWLVTVLILIVLICFCGGGIKKNMQN